MLVFVNRSFRRKLELDDVMRDKPSWWGQCAYQREPEKLSSILHMRIQREGGAWGWQGELTLVTPHLRLWPSEL